MFLSTAQTRALSRLMVALAEPHGESEVRERIGTGLQSPFRLSEHQIQMEALCETIEKNLQSMQRDSLGDVHRVEETV